MRSDIGKNGMTPKQKIAAENIAAGQTIEYAAVAAKVASRTVYRWLEGDTFTQGIADYQRDATKAHMRALTGELRNIRTIVLACMNDADAGWSARLKACDMLESSLHRWRDAVDIEERIAALEARIDHEN